MPATDAKENAIGVTAFESRCLGLIDQVAEGKVDRIILLKHNKPVAAIVPIAKDGDDPFELWGAMRGTVTFLPDIDLTEPTGEIWDAEQ
jgi:antitoxin (DNA-binding transcriptional repressor) of toxin-antitoxin stability system